MRASKGKSHVDPRAAVVPASVASRVTGFVRSAGVLFDLPDRMLHPLRRATARRDVARAEPIASVLFVCRGNVCRSPFAAAVLARTARESLETQIRVSSAGLIGHGRRPPRAALAAASERHVDMRAHRATLASPPLVSAADLVIVMDAEQESVLRRRFQKPRSRIIILGDLDPQPIRERTIRDPMGHDATVFDETYDRIGRCIVELVRVLRAAQDAAGPYDSL